MTDLTQGRIDVLFGPLALQLPHVMTGNIRQIALTNARRAPSAPELTTVVEQGEPELEISGLLGLFGPSSTPPEVVERVAADVRAVAADPGVRDRLLKVGLEVHAEGAAAWKKALDDFSARIEPIAKTYGVKPNP